MNLQYKSITLPTQNPNTRQGYYVENRFSVIKNILTSLHTNPNSVPKELFICDSQKNPTTLFLMAKRFHFFRALGKVSDSPTSFKCPPPSPDVLTNMLYVFCCTAYKKPQLQEPCYHYYKGAYPNKFVTGEEFYTQNYFIETLLNYWLCAFPDSKNVVISSFRQILNRKIDEKCMGPAEFTAVYCKNYMDRIQCLGQQQQQQQSHIQTKPFTWLNIKRIESAYKECPLTVPVLVENLYRRIKNRMFICYDVEKLTRMIGSDGICALFTLFLSNEENIRNHFNLATTTLSCSGISDKLIGPFFNRIEPLVNNKNKKGFGFLQHIKIVLGLTEVILKQPMMDQDSYVSLFILYLEKTSGPLDISFILDPLIRNSRFLDDKKMGLFVRLLWNCYINKYRTIKNMRGVIIKLCQGFYGNENPLERVENERTLLNFYKVVIAFMVTDNPCKENLNLINRLILNNKGLMDKVYDEIFETLLFTIGGKNLIFLRNFVIGPILLLFGRLMSEKKKSRQDQIKMFTKMLRVYCVGVCVCGGNMDWLGDKVPMEMFDKQVTKQITHKYLQRVIHKVICAKFKKSIPPNVMFQEQIIPENDYISIWMYFKMLKYIQ
jgi:hypothetical protein